MSDPSSADHSWRSFNDAGNPANSFAAKSAVAAFALPPPRPASGGIRLLKYTCTPEVGQRRPESQREHQKLIAILHSKNGGTINDKVPCNTQFLQQTKAKTEPSAIPEYETETFQAFAADRRKMSICELWCCGQFPCQQPNGARTDVSLGYIFFTPRR